MTARQVTTRADRITTPSYTNSDQTLAAVLHTTPPPISPRSVRIFAGRRKVSSRQTRNVSLTGHWPVSTERGSCPRLNRLTIARASKKSPARPHSGSAAPNAYKPTISPITMTGGYR